MHRWLPNSMLALLLVVACAAHAPAALADEVASPAAAGEPDQSAGSALGQNADESESAPTGDNISAAAGDEAGGAESESPGAGGAAETSSGPLTGTRDLLAMFDIGRAFFAPFVDDEPLAFDEQEKMFRLLYRVERIPVVQAERWARGGPAWRQLLARPAEFRGEIFHIEGLLSRVTTVPLTAELRERFELSACYRCRIVAEDGTLVDVLTATVPKSWPIDQPLEERVSALGLFAKRARIDDEEDGSATHPLEFVASRVAWYPNTALGRLRMDAGLLDQVRDRRPLTADERECFYQMLAAVERSKTQALERAASEGFARRIPELRETIPKLPAHSQQLLLARHELERAEKNLSDVVPLFREPEAERGKLVVLEGRARRALEVTIDEPDLVERFGIRRYYEVEIFPDDSQGNPVVCCVRELPAEMPHGDGISERVRVAGFFIKSWMYRASPAGNVASADQPRHALQRLAPLLVARQAVWLPDAAPMQSTLIGALTAGGLAIISLLMLVGAWRTLRGTRRSYRQIVASGRPGEPHEAPIDFSHLK